MMAENPEIEEVTKLGQGHTQRAAEQNSIQQF